MGVSVPGEVTKEGQPAAPIRSFVEVVRSAFAPVSAVLRPLEVDTRMLGMVGALAVIWIAFDIVSGGTFLSRATSGTYRSRAPRSGSWPRGWS